MAIEGEEEKEEEIISEGAEYSPKSEFSKARVVEKVILLCIEARGREMRPGYYNTKLTKDGQPIRIWIEDARKVFVGRVDALLGVLDPEIIKSSTRKEEIKKLLDKRKIAFNKYSYQEQVLKKGETNRLLWVSSDSTIIPEIDDVVIIINPRRTDTATEIKGGWNLKVNAYWNDLVKIYDGIFATLNSLIDDLNYFKQGISW